MNLLQKDIAPLTEQAWQRLETQARSFFDLNLSTRKVVDVKGPKEVAPGFFPADKLTVEQLREDGTKVGQGLAEARADFELDMRALNDADTGAENIDLSDLLESVKQIATFEEKAVYYGLKPAAIEGLKSGKLPQSLEEAGRPGLSALGGESGSDRAAS